jgi:hypothetical protein
MPDNDTNLPETLPKCSPVHIAASFILLLEGIELSDDLHAERDDLIGELRLVMQAVTP